MSSRRCRDTRKTRVTGNVALSMQVEGLRSDVVPCTFAFNGEDVDKCAFRLLQQAPPGTAVVVPIIAPLHLTPTRVTSLSTVYLLSKKTDVGVHYSQLLWARKFGNTMKDATCHDTHLRRAHGDPKTKAFTRLREIIIQQPFCGYVRVLRFHTCSLLFLCFPKISHAPLYVKRGCSVRVCVPVCSSPLNFHVHRKSLTLLLKHTEAKFKGNAS